METGLCRPSLSLSLSLSLSPSSSVTRLIARGEVGESESTAAMAKVRKREKQRCNSAGLTIRSLNTVPLKKNVERASGGPSFVGLFAWNGIATFRSGIKRVEVESSTAAVEFVGGDEAPLDDEIWTSGAGRGRDERKWLVRKFDVCFIRVAAENLKCRVTWMESFYIIKQVGRVLFT